MILSHEDILSSDDELTEEQVRKYVFPVSSDYIRWKEEFKKGTGGSYVIVEFRRLFFQFVSIFDEHIYQFLPRNNGTYPLFKAQSDGFACLLQERLSNIKAVGGNSQHVWQHLLELYSEIDRLGILKVMIKRLFIKHQEFKVIITDTLHWLEQNLTYLLRFISDIEFQFNDIDKDSGILMDWEKIQDEF